RSALAYSSTYNGAESVCRRVHVGVSTSSTTSRSTNKTGSSPYRSDTHLRHTSTSTSNYNCDRDPYLSSRSHRTTLHLRPAEPTEARGQRRESESDTDGSQAEGGGRSLDLASSHSSDEDDVTSRSHRNMGVSTQQHVTHSYLPNIHTNPAEHLNILCSNTELFPNIKPIYAPRWSSQLPEAYLSSE
ncbi:Protocadherin-like wing polarity protein stan, partial [Ooceraea biroi]